MRRSRLVYYAINDHPFYIELVRRSLIGLRRNNRKIPVRIVFFGHCRKSVRQVFTKLGAEVIEREAVRANQGTFLKWLALADVQGDHDLLFLDADTFVFRNVIQLFRVCTGADFAARREIGASLYRKKGLLGTVVVRPTYDRQELRKVTQTLKCAQRPLMNTGVMFLSPRAQREILAHFRYFERFETRFREDKIPYPSENIHILEEVVTTLVLGRCRGLRYRFISPKHSPWYVEWKAGIVSDPGIVLHTWTDYYPFCLADLEGSAALRSKPFKGLIELEYRP